MSKEGRGRCGCCPAPDFRGSFWGVVGKKFTRLTEFVREPGILETPELPFHPYPHFKPHPTLSVEFPNLIDDDDVERECFGAACTMLADGSINGSSARGCSVVCWLHYVPVGETNLDNAVAAFGRVPVGDYESDVIPVAEVGEPVVWLVNNLDGDPEVWDDFRKLDVHLDGIKAFVGPGHVGWIYKRWADDGKTNRLVVYSDTVADPTETLWHNNSYSDRGDCTTDVTTGSVPIFTEAAWLVVDVSRTRFPEAAGCRTEVQYDFMGYPTDVSKFVKHFDIGDMRISDGLLDRPVGMDEEYFDFFRAFPFDKVGGAVWEKGITRPTLDHIAITDALFRTPVLEFELGRFRRPESQIYDSFYGTLLIMSTARGLDVMPAIADEENTTLLFGNVHFGFTGTGADYNSSVFENHLTYDEVEDGLTTEWRAPNDAFDPYVTVTDDVVYNRTPIRQYSNYGGVDLDDSRSAEASFQFLTRGFREGVGEGTAGITITDMDPTQTRVNDAAFIFGAAAEALSPLPVNKQALMATATVRTVRDAASSDYGPIRSYSIVIGQEFAADPATTTGLVVPATATIGGAIAEATDWTEGIHVATPFYDATSGTPQPMPAPTGFWLDRRDPEEPVLRRGRFCFAAMYDDHSVSEADIFAGWTPPE